MRAVLFALAVAMLPLPVVAQPVVVELFTSQGCSSCPPADAFLSDLAHTRGDVLPLAFHITYWDRLGWKDPYSLDAATSRQEAYAHGFGDNQVYTPEMVVDGARGVIGSDRRAGLAAIAGAAQAHGPAIPLRLVRDGESLVVSVGAGSGSAKVVVVGFDAEHETHIGRGENGGRTLHESDIVRSLGVAGQWTGQPAEYRAPIPAGDGFAVLLQAEEGRIVGAARLNG